MRMTRSEPLLHSSEEGPLLHSSEAGPVEDEMRAGGEAGGASEPTSPREVTAPLVTVGLPVYNGMPWLSEAIESVLGQTYGQLELVIADNGSTDETEAVCREYAAVDPRVRYERSEVNRGAAYNWNRVLELARGEYFKWFADDDVCDPTLLERSVEAMEARRGAALAYPRTRFIDERGTTFCMFDPRGRLAEWPAEPLERGRQMLDALFDREHDLDLICTVGIFGLTRTSALRAVRPLGGFSGADWIVVLELALAGEVIQLPESLSVIRRHPDALSWQNFQPGVSRTEFAKAQQRFHDPSKHGRLAAEIGLWRRYWEMAVGIAGSPLPVADRARLLARYVRICGSRAAQRGRRTLRARLGAVRSSEG
jgi:glycosyltransferase involved in cell wall biosynthesis